MVAVWDFTSFWQFDILFAQCLIIMHLLTCNVSIKHTRMTSLTSFLRKCYLPSLLRPMLSLVGGFPISSDGYFYLFGGNILVIGQLLFFSSVFHRSPFE